MRRAILIVVLAVLWGAVADGVPSAAAQTVDDNTDIRKLALQVSDKDPETMNSALNIAVNVSQFYNDQALEVQIEIVTFAAGVDMLLAERSPVKERLKAFEASMPNVTFQICDNTLDTIERNSGQRPAVLPLAKHVTAGVAHLIELHNAGWTIVRP